MTAKLSLLVLMTISVMTGCSLFKSNQSSTPYSDLSYTTDNQQELLVHYIKKAEDQLLALEKVTQGRCLNGQMTITHSLLTRVKKEYQNSMYRDAFITLTDYDRQVRKTHCILTYLEGKFGCQITQKVSVLKHWYQEGRYEQCDSLVNEGSSPIASGNNDKIVVNTLTPLSPAFTATDNEIVVETLHEFNSATIKPIYFNALNKIANLMVSYPQSSVSVTGHADSLGSSQYNLNLSKQRAQTIANYLSTKGVKAPQISIISKGEGNIRVTESNDLARMFNRYSLLTIKLNIADIEHSQGVVYD
jgi:outer membrane protein OmpA-like peptidoglycan-associated protein